MNTCTKISAALLMAAGLLAAGCASNPPLNPAVQNARADLNALKADSQLGTRAPAAIADAEDAVRVAEVAQQSSDPDVNHLAYLANRKIAIARAQAQGKLASDQMTALADERDRVQLDARTREAQSARSDARMQKQMAQQALTEATTQRRDAESARQQAYSALAQAQSSQQQADIAMMEANDYKRQLDELQAKQTDRGMVVTLGDVLFATARSDLKPGNQSRLDKLATFLNKYPDRTLIVEGHTDSVGGEDYNLALSQRRAEAVKQYLVSNGVQASRIRAMGKGKAEPVASNGDNAGRQQNRRVEVVIQGS